MKTRAFDIGPIHFVGIGGIGMSGLAEILNDQGYTVQGSDMKASANTERLENKGIKVFVGHDEKNIKDAAVVVLSSAIKKGNPELEAALENRIPVIKRADMLAEIMRMKWSIAIAGTHGKTTTTSLVGTMLEACDFDPTVINGGIINAYGSNTRLGKSDWLVAEADESDGTFTRLPCAIGCITNIDPEHMDHYADFEKMKDAYKMFVDNIPFYGFAVVCIDHPVVREMLPAFTHRNVLTYGFADDADYKAFNVRRENGMTLFDLKMPNDDVIQAIELQMAGDHNVSNSVIACAIADKLGASKDQIASGLKTFNGVKRRFTHVDTINGIEIIDDYGHHPVEIRAVLNAARQANETGKIVAIMQPHRYSRLNDLMDDFANCFDGADHVAVLDVYSAGEDPIEGVSGQALATKITELGKVNATHLKDMQEIACFIDETASAGDSVIFMGAGDITKIAYEMPALLKEKNCKTGS
tara:strand:+ start:2804 stop:4213 length:1410 start_codon:yes stop_codon:yes gene_type:complete